MDNWQQIITAERVRTEAESARQQQERRRQDQELSRATAETTRVLADEGRVAAAKEVSETVATLTKLLERMEAVEEMRRASRTGF